MRARRLSLMMLVLALLSLAVPLAAQDDTGPVTLEVEAGYNGIFREEYWLPVRVRVQNSGASLTGRVVVRPETSGRVVSNAYSVPIDLPTGSDQTTFLYIIARGANASVRVELLDDDGVQIANQLAPMTLIQPQDILSIAVSGPGAEPVPLNGMTVGGYSAAQANWSVSEIPEKGPALDAVDLILFNNVDTGVLTSGQRSALFNWVSGGGQLIVTGGPNWEGTADGLVDILPFIPDGSATINDLSELAQLAGFPDGALTGNTIIATGDVIDGAEVMARSDDLPLVIRQRYGGGIVYYLAVDPSLQPMRGWDEIANLWVTLLTSSGSQPGWTLGFTDFQQSALAASTLPGVDLLPAVQLLCVFLGGYILLIGPVNYFLLSRINRREWAWVTIPVLIIVFSVISWTVGFNLRGNEVTISNLTVVESWATNEQARVNQLIGVLSPRRATYSMSMTDNRLIRVIPSLQQETLISSNVLQSDVEVVQGSVFEAESFSVDGGIFANFATTGTLDKPAISGRMTLNYGDNGTQTLQGAIRNDSDIVLQDPVLLARGVAYQLNGDLNPGDIVTLDGSEITLANQNGVPSASSLEYDYTELGSISTLSVFGRRSTINQVQTISDVMGANYLNSLDFRGEIPDFEMKTIRRRQAFLTSFMRDQYGATSRDNRVYLTGWSDIAPVGVDFANAESISVETTLYIIEMEVTIDTPPPSQTVTIAPDQFTWISRERDDPEVGNPIDLTLYPDTSFVLRFTPVPGSVLDDVNTLRVEYNRASGFGRQIELSLWNWQTGEWDQMDNLTNSPDNFELRNPDAYIGPNNAVEVHIVNTHDVSTARIRDLRVIQVGRFN